MYASICRPNYLASSPYKIFRRFLTNRCVIASPSTVKTHWLLNRRPATLIPRLTSTLGNLSPEIRINTMSNQSLITRHLSSKSTNDNIKTSNNNQNSDPDQKNMSALKRLRIVFRDYGTTGVAFHIVTSLLSLGCWYMAVQR